MTVWSMTTGNAGSRGQAKGLALSLSASARDLVIRLPWLAVFQPLVRLGMVRLVPDRGRLGPPWPDVLITCGRGGGLVSPLIRRASGHRTVTVHIERPAGGSGAFDLVVVLPHDDLTGDNVLCLDTALNAVTADRLCEAAAVWRAKLAHHPRPWTGVLLGGSTRSRRFTLRHAEQLIGDLERMRRIHGGSLLITPSRRTPAAVARRLQSHFEGDDGVFFWSGAGPNPYLGILGSADRLVVTSDSISMLSEALATTAAVSVFDISRPGGRHAQFLAHLVERGLVRLTTDEGFAQRTHPTNATLAVADAVRALLAGRQAAAAGRRG